jgi:putative ATP-dependent endonuclease of the OLD family
MYVSRLEIENFRGIRSASIDIGETTVLIGENDSGKTTLLDAISLVLSPAYENRNLAFKFRDFFMIKGKDGYNPAGTLYIRITFRERSPDEWSYIKNNDFGLTLPDNSRVLQELTLEVRSEPVAEGEEATSKWRLVIEGRSRTDYSDDPAVLSWIRRLNPVFRLKGGILAYFPDEGQTVSDTGLKPSYPENEIEKLKSKIEEAYKNLISGSTTDGGDEIHDGYNAALQYLARSSDLFFHDGPPLDQILYEILGRKSENSEKSAKRIILRHGSAAEKIGMLLFTTAFLQSGGLEADPSSEPVLIIEDPEAHLHPMTLESFKLLIGRLKWQKIITTQSGSLLSDFPLDEIRRITKSEGYISQYRVKPGSLSSDELRRLSYHVRKRLHDATFARCWLLVEGESEIWLLPHLAKLCGYDLAMEGVICVEFAQCGIAPLVKAATQLGIDWFLLSDGDAAGKSYFEIAKHFALQAGENPEDHSLRFREKDIEHHFFFNGYADVYAEYSGIPLQVSQNMQPKRIIERALHRNSKPFMAIAVIEAVARKDSPGVPQELKKVVEKCVRLAKESSVVGR